MLIKKYFSFFILLIYFSCQTLFAEDVLSVYSYSPMDGGVNLVEIIDFGFYEDGLLKYIKTYWAGPGMKSWEDDDGERSDLKIMWQYPQYFVEREADNRIVLKVRRYNSDGVLVKEENERYFRIQDDSHFVSWLEGSDRKITVLIESDFSYSLINNGERRLAYLDDRDSGEISYNYLKSDSFYNFWLLDGILKEYDYYQVSVESSRWQYEIDYDPETEIYNIESYDPGRDEHLYEDRYVIKRREIEMSPLTSSMNYFLSRGNRVLLPFVTRTVITQPEE